MLSIVIPARNEIFLQKTIEDILTKAKEEVEIIAILDGYWPQPAIQDHPSVILLHNSEPKGMRPGINAGARIAKGKYLMKCDAHCCFDEGFDVKLKKDCKYDWTVVPRRYSLNTKTWDKGDKIYDFQFISHPDDKKYPFKGVDWPEYAERVKGKKIVGLMTSQGSCWFMHRQRFFDLGGLDDVNYGIMGREAQETCLKAWLSGGKYVLNRNTWYAHWKKNAGRDHPERATYPKPRGEWGKSKDFLIKTFWKQDPPWPMQKRDINWLIKKFAPVPTWHETETLAASRRIKEKFKLNDMRESPIKIGNKGRGDLYEAFNEIGFKVGAEVGVWQGRNAENMFEKIDGLKLYLVDPYLNHAYVRKPRDEQRIKKAYDRAHKVLEGKNCVWLEMMSEKAVWKIKDEELDFVYIDAEHSYDACMHDIILWIRKVKKGGIVAGHDFYNNGKLKIGVAHAVEDYTKRNNIERWYLTDRKADLPEQYQRDNKKLSKVHASWFFIKT